MSRKSSTASTEVNEHSPPKADIATPAAQVDHHADISSSANEADTGTTAAHADHSAETSKSTDQAVSKTAEVSVAAHVDQPTETPVVDANHSKTSSETDPPADANGKTIQPPPYEEIAKPKVDGKHFYFIFFNNFICILLTLISGLI